jgi:hypothetical protein
MSLGAGDLNPHWLDNPAAVYRRLAVLEAVGANSGFTAGESTGPSLTGR